MQKLFDQFVMAADCEYRYDGDSNIFYVIFSEIGIGAYGRDRCSDSVAIMDKRLYWYAKLLFLLLCIHATGVQAVSMKEVVRQIGRHADEMQLGHGITLPMVRIENDKVIVRRLIYFARTTPEYGTAITEPQYIAVYDLSGEAFVALNRFEMDVPDLPPPPWIHNRPAFEKPEDIVPEFERIWALYDLLIPAFLSGDAVANEKVLEAAKEYVQYFERHAEKPLLPYYELFSGDFLRWVRRVADS